MTVCSDASFTTDSQGRLTLADPGKLRVVKTAYQTSSGDGPYTDAPSPGKTMIDIDVSWTNTTGIRQRVMVWLDRAPWTIISTNMSQARLMERWNVAWGTNPRAATPSGVSTEIFSSVLDNPPAWAFWWVTSPARPAVSYSSQNRSSVMMLAPTILEPGQGVNVRYMVTLFTDGQPVVNGGTPKREAYCRWSQVSVWGMPGPPPA